MSRICTIHVTNTNNRIQCLKGDNLREVLQAEGYLLPAFCGGKGICGKCEVLIEEKGRQLACRTQVQEDMMVTLLAVEQESAANNIVSHMENELKNREDFVEVSSSNPQKITASATNRYTIAIDIGTTTLAFALLESASGKCTGSYTALNSQRMYGADVLSRIQAEQEGKGSQLQVCIQKDLAEGMRYLLAERDIKPEQIEHIVITGNTVMLHLLRGYTCKGLCRYPFEPEQLGAETLLMKELFVETVPIETDLGKVPLTLLPGITAFVGADITAGVYACDMEKEKNSVLIDMGTNGEIVLKAGRKYYVTSVAAGPAFEGGNILWGIGSVNGAISGAKIEKDGLHITTIGDTAPVGICGTGLIELVAELLQNNIIDETGKLTDLYFAEGYPVAKTKDGKSIVLTQKDIRQFQMAKAALCTGIEMLLEKAGIACEEVEKVYLAGGFGCYLNIEKGAKTGLIPWKLSNKTIAIGNTALLGAEKILTDSHGLEALETIVKNSIEVELSMEPEFQESFLENINFR